MSLDIRFGGTASDSTSVNDGFHKLPKDCYPPTESESEGEESFVVLNDPESSFIGVVEAFQRAGVPTPSPNEPLSAAPIERSLNVLNELAQSAAINRSKFSLLSLSEDKNDTSDPMKQSGSATPAMAQSVGAEDSKDNSLIKVNGQELNLSLIQSRVQMYSWENAQLKDAVKQNNIAMKEQCEKIIKLRESYKNSIEQGLENLQKAVKEAEQLKIDNEELKHVRDEQKKFIRQLQTDITLVNKNNADLQANKIVIDNKRMANMRSFELESAERKIADTTISLQTAIEKRNALQTQLNILETQLESSNYKHLEEIARLKEKLFCYEQMADHYKQSEAAQRTMTNQMTEMQMNIVEMTTRMNALTTTNGVLEEQLKIYQADFQEEREARRNLKRDEDQIKGDMEFLLKLNEDLKIENARLKFPHAPPEPPTNSPAAEVYMCPWCHFGFFNFNALQNHTQRCPEAFEQV